MRLDYANDYVAGLCLLPTFIAVCLLSLSLDILFFAIVLVVTLFLSAGLYRFVVLQKGEDVKRKRYFFLLGIQAIFWVGIFLVSTAFHL